MHFDRAAGVLLHITSLPGEFGVGDLGQGAYEFVDFLARSGQSVWQVLPLGPTLQGDSPYSCYSAFAGNPLLISLSRLQEAGLLTEQLLESLRSQYHPAAGHSCDYRVARQAKWKALEAAFDHFLTRSRCEQFDPFEAFCTQHRWWLDDFALFAALQKHFGTDNWTRWEPSLVNRESEALGQWKEKLSRDVEFEQFVQYLFYQQWESLRDYARRQGVRLFGDMPIFVAHGSADVWAHQRLFCLEETGESQFVAGVPPDYFSRTGQLWGNPLYDWEALQQTGYRWWVQRFKSAFEFVDLLRIDHFRGFESYWQVSAKAKTAVNGRWVEGPRAGPFDAAREQLGELAIVAEDLGLITDEVHALRDQLGFPGMRVLQFGFDHVRDGYHRPEEYPERSVAYTGTHDNSTIVAWYESRREKKLSQELLAPYLQQQPEDWGLAWKLLAMVYHSKSWLAIAPLQDILGLGDEARMNTPGQPSGNWTWRFEPHQLDNDVVHRLRTLTESTGRC